MDIWKKAGQYLLVLPEEWSISDFGDTVEIEPKSRDAAVHVSVFRKSSRGMPNEGEARSIVENFALKNRLDAVGDLTFVANTNSFSCLGHYKCARASEQPIEWLVRGIVGMQKAVVCTLCSDNRGSRSYLEGSEILSTVALDEV